MPLSPPPSRGIRFADLDISGKSVQIEYQWIAPERRDRPLIVFLHEGLGSIALWKDWPEQLCRAVDSRGLVFSRYGYGQSTPRPKGEKWPASYLHDEARHVLPALFEQLGIDADGPPTILLGHSDGGTIALLYAAAFPARTAGIIVAAPHIFVEDMMVESLRQARQAYLDTDWGEKLGRYHKDADSVFWTWNNAWLDPAFRDWNIEDEIAAIRCPVLALQGEQDEYATLDQIHGIHRQVPQTEVMAIPDCRHSPHKDKPQVVEQAVRRFLPRAALFAYSHRKEGTAIQSTGATGILE